VLEEGLEEMVQKFIQMILEEGKKPMNFPPPNPKIYTPLDETYLSQ